MKSLSGLIIILVIASALVSSLSCVRSNPFVKVNISGPIVIDEDEKKIVFVEPFIPRRQVVRVCFEFGENMVVHSVSEPPSFPDGTRLRLTATLIDIRERKYDLTHIAKSAQESLCISPELSDEWTNISKNKVSFVKLEVSSNRSIKIKRIEWVSFNSWDWDL